MQQTHVTLMDATCVESYLRYPTSVKLIWEGVVQVYRLGEEKRKQLKLRRSRSNYVKHKQQFLDFQRSRKKTKRKEKKLRRQLLKYLLRLLKGLAGLAQQRQFRFSRKEQKLLVTIEEMYQQQHTLL
jgi:hypothetical protein